MHFQKINQIQYNPVNDQNRNNQNQYNRNIRNAERDQFREKKEYYHSIIPNSQMLDNERNLELSNDESNSQPQYKSHSIIRTIKNNINEKYDPSQLAGDKPLSSAIYNLSSRFGEERDPSPKTINIGDTKETIEYNIRTLNVRKSPRYYEEFYPPPEANLELNETEPRNGSFEGRRYIGQNINNSERGNIIVNRYSIDNNNSSNLMDRNSEFVVNANIYNVPRGGEIAIGGETSQFQNFDEMNTSNEVERGGSEERKSRTPIQSATYDYRTNRFRNLNMMQTQTMDINDMNNMNNYNNINNLNNYNNMNNNNQMNMTHTQFNTMNLARDNVQEKYANKTYDNMTYKDVKKIVRRFTKVYDPNKNNNGLLVEESQVTFPGANDDVFNNRYRVLSKMNRLSNILLSKQRRPSPHRLEDDFPFNYTDDMRTENFDNNKYRIRTNKSFNRQSFIKRARSPIKMPNRKSPENKFKYVSLAMISSKGLRTEDRIILRKMRFEKGGVVDLAQEDKKRGRYKIRKVSRSPGYKRNFFKTNPKYREKAARYIQSWWKEMKKQYQKKIKKIIKIQSVYRGRFVRKYLYDLLYLNYLYLSFCQKIEKVLKQQIKPYVFNILKNYGKKLVSQEEREYNILRNIIASKATKWRILNLRKSFEKWKRFCRNKEKLLLIIYKILKLRVENQNKDNILRNALRKWNYLAKTMKIIEEFEVEKKTIINKKIIIQTELDKQETLKEINLARDENTMKIRGLFKLLEGIKKYSKKSALEPTLPKLVKYLTNQRLIKLLKKIINKKELIEKEKLKDYFYKYIKMTLKYITNKINELPEEKKIIVHELTKEKELLINREYTFNPEREKFYQEKITKLKKISDEYDKEKRMKARIFLYMIKNIKDKQNKNILRKYFTKYFKKVVQLQREEDRINFEEKERKANLEREKEREQEKERERQREKERQLEKEREKQREKERQQEKEREKQRERERQLEKEREKQREKERQLEKEREKQREEEDKKIKKEISEYQEIIEKYEVTQTKTEYQIYYDNIINKKELYDKYNKEFLDKLKACEILRKYTLRNTHKYLLEAFQDKLSKLREIYILKIIKKNNLKNKILKKYFDKWRNKTFEKYRRDSIRKLFVKIITIVNDNYIKRILRKKLYQWKNNIKEPEKIIEKIQPTIFDTLKNVKDIINFNDYLRNVTVNKFAKVFLENLEKSRNPALKIKYLKKIVKKKTRDVKSALRRAFNKWKNNVEVEKAIEILKTRLIFTIYDKNKNIEQNNLLQKWFNKWKNITIVEKIKDNINILRHIQNEKKIISIKTIIRNNNRNNNKDILKQYLNKWRDVLKSDIPRLDELNKRITRINILKNGPQFLDKLKINRNFNRKNELLLRFIPKRLKNEKFLLYKYLIRWRNKLYGINTKNMNIIYGEKIISILLNKIDKENIIKAFNKWRYGKNEKVPVNAYLAAIKKIKTVICKKPFEKFIYKLDKTNPKKLRPKAIRIEKIIEKITKIKPFTKFIKNVKTIIRVNQLKKIQPKVHEITKKYYLQKYFDRWRNITKEQRLKNMKIITKWLKKKYDIEKERKRKRRNELLKRIINNLIKEDRHKMRFPLHFWKRITNIYIENDNARIIQNFCREILLKIQKKKLQDQKKLTNLIIKLYKKTIIKTVTDKNDVGEVNKYINTKNENTKKLRDIFNHRDKNNNRLLLRLALLKWNEGKDKYDKSIQIIQNKIRQIISKNKLNDKRLLQTILKHIVKNNENKNKTFLRNKLLQWYAIAKKLNYHDTSKIEEFIRKIVVERLRRKLETTLNRYTFKYFIYLFDNIAKFNKLKNALRKEPTRDAFNKIKNYIRRENIKEILTEIVKDKDDKLRILLIKKYLNKWNNKVKDINNKRYQSILIIQKIFRGKKIKKDVDRERKIKKTLLEIFIRYTENSPLNLYFAKWKRITRRIICDENARIIQNFCREIHNKYLKNIKDKNDEIYKKLAIILTTIGKNPKRDFFDILKIINKNEKLRQLLDNLDKKRKDILRDAFYNISKYKNLTVLRNSLDIKENQNYRILKKYLIKWRNIASRNKYIIVYLTKFIKNKEKTNKNLLRSIIYTWLYKAHLKTVKEKEKIISRFFESISRKRYIIKKWRELSDKLKNREKAYDIDEIYLRLKKYLGFNIFKKIVKTHVKKDVNDLLRKNNDVTVFKKRIEILINKIEYDTNEISIKKYFDIWRNNTKKIRNRMDKLDELMKILGAKQKRDDANTLYRVILIKKLLNNIPKFYLIYALKRIKEYANTKNKNQKLADDLLLIDKDIESKRISPLIKRLYKVYTYKVFDNLFNKIQIEFKKKSQPSKYIFLSKMIQNYTDRYKDYTYSNQIENEKKPYSKKIVFKTKKKEQPKINPNKSQIYLSLTSILVKLIDDLIKKNKKDTFYLLKRRYIYEKFNRALKNYVYEKEKPNFEDFFERIRVLIDIYEHDGPQKAKLFKLLRKNVIKKLFVYKEAIYRVNKLFYLLNLTMLNLEMSKSRYIRQIIRKWRFVTFMKKMTKKKNGTFIQKSPCKLFRNSQ